MGGGKTGTLGDQDGVVLLLVLLVLALISVLVLGWAQEWRLELKCAANDREGRQCHQLASAGVYYAMGKLATDRVTGTNAARTVALPPEGADQPTEIWQGDRELHVLDFPGGRVEVRVEDEGGKINLNNASDQVLTRLFTVLGFPALKVRTMVDSLLDWRTGGEQARPYGAKSDYYLGLDPPYVAKNGAFEVVEELTWVHGFEESPLVPRLGTWLTVQGNGGININSAPKEVLQALGLTPEAAAHVVDARKTQPFKNLQEMAQLFPGPSLGSEQRLSFQSLPFFTIISTGMVKQSGGRHTIKAIVRFGGQMTWRLVSWVDDFPE